VIPTSAFDTFIHAYFKYLQNLREVKSTTSRSPPITPGFSMSTLVGMGLLKTETLAEVDVETQTAEQGLVARTAQD
jgi:hypothetical protein